MRMRARAPLIGLLVAGVVIGVGLYSKRRSPRPPQEIRTVPALEAGEDEALALDATTERRPGERRVRLRLRGKAGEALLVLQDPGPSDPGNIAFAFGKATIVPGGDRGAGAAFVAAVATWLRQPPAPLRTQSELKPFAISYVRIGTDDGWEANKLFIERGRRQAEVFLNLSTDGGQARLIEKDEEYAADLVALLAMALRDGVPPRRTPHDDPLVASMQPLFARFQRVAGVEEAHAPVALRDGFLAARGIDRDGKRGSELLRWSHPSAAPKRAAAVDGVVSDMLASPDDRYAALAVTFPSMRGGTSSDDPGMQVLVDLTTGRIDKLESADGIGFSFSAAFSPDAARLAIAAQSVTRAYDVASRRLLGSTPAVLDVRPLRWNADGLLLFHADYELEPPEDGGPTLSYYRWLPGQGDPRATAAPALLSPDGRHRIEVTKDGLVITGHGATRRVVASRREDIEAFRALGEVENQHWIGPQLVLIHLDEPMVVDLATGKLRYLFPADGGGLHLEVASRDGRTLIARDDQDTLLWAQR